MESHQGTITLVENFFEITLAASEDAIFICDLLTYGMEIEESKSDWVSTVAQNSQPLLSCEFRATDSQKTVKDWSELM